MATIKTAEVTKSYITTIFWSRAATTGSDTSHGLLYNSTYIGVHAPAHSALRLTVDTGAVVQAVNRTSGRSGSASEDDPAERGCSRSRTTLGSTPMTPGGSQMTASLGGRYDPWPVKRSSE